MHTIVFWWTSLYSHPNSFKAFTQMGSQLELWTWNQRKTCFCHWVQGRNKERSKYQIVFNITPPNSEIICGRNVSTKVVCGIILFFEKKAMLKIWKKSWVPFRSYLLNSTANPAHLHSNWAGLAVLFSR